MSIEKTTGMGAATWLPTRSLGLKQFFQFCCSWASTASSKRLRVFWTSSGSRTTARSRSGGAAAAWPQTSRRRGATSRLSRRRRTRRLTSARPPKGRKMTRSVSWDCFSSLIFWRNRFPLSYGSLIITTVTIRKQPTYYFVKGSLDPDVFYSRDPFPSWKLEPP